jgi:predicted nuclease of predicted toxin-antitoxin system
LLDQNVPRELAPWMRQLRPAWRVVHTSDIGLSNTDDAAILAWATAQDALVVTFDEDFADRRFRDGRTHPGIVRLRVWPTTVEEARSALQRLLHATTEDELRGALVIVDRTRIRIRIRSG